MPHVVKDPVQERISEPATERGVDVRVPEMYSGSRGAHKEQDFRLRVAWVRAHISAKSKAQMMQRNVQIAVAIDKADELAKGGATMDGAEFVEHAAKGADKVHKHLCAAVKHAPTFHGEVGDVVVLRCKRQRRM